jgi:hypothetical protein
VSTILVDVVAINDKLALLKVVAHLRPWTLTNFDCSEEKGNKHKIAVAGPELLNRRRCRTGVVKYIIFNFQRSQIVDKTKS